MLTWITRLLCNLRDSPILWTGPTVSILYWIYFEFGRTEVPGWGGVKKWYTKKSSLSFLGRNQSLYHKRPLTPPVFSAVYTWLRRHDSPTRTRLLFSVVGLTGFWTPGYLRSRVDGKQLQGRPTRYTNLNSCKGVFSGPLSLQDSVWPVYSFHSESLHFGKPPTVCPSFFVLGLNLQPDGLRSRVRQMVVVHIYTFCFVSLHLRRNTSRPRDSLFTLLFLSPLFS